MASAPRSYEDFQPHSDWVRGEDGDTLVVDLAGFKREQLKVELDNSGILMISGERQLNGNKWSRFRKQVLVPEDCDVREIQAMFEDGELRIIMPTTITWEEPDEHASPTKKSPISTQRTGTGETPKSVNNLNGTPTAFRDGGGVDDRRATSADGAGKRKNNEPINAAAEVTIEMMKKEETGKDVDGSRKSVVDGGLVKESGMRLVLGLNESRQLMVNVIVAFLVALALGIYVKNKFSSPHKAEN